MAKRTARAAIDLGKTAFEGWRADNCMSMGAALAFYSLLSMAPLLVLVITLSGLFIGREQAQDLLLTQLSGLLGPTGGEGVRTMLASASRDEKGLIQTAISFVVLLVGATTVFGELQDDLNRIWGCATPARGGLRSQLRKRLLSFGLIATIGFLLITSLAVSAAISYLGGAWFGGSELVARMLELGASLAVTTVLFAVVYKFLPACPIAWRDVGVGALATAILFGIGKYLIGLYIGRSAVASDFGAAGTVVVVIVWVYYSSQVFFLGAEFTRAWSKRRAKVESPANAEFRSESAEMLEVARRIVRGTPPSQTT